MTPSRPRLTRQQVRCDEDARINFNNLSIFSTTTPFIKETSLSRSTPQQPPTNSTNLFLARWLKNNLPFKMKS